MVIRKLSVFILHLFYYNVFFSIIVLVDKSNTAERDKQQYSHGRRQMNKACNKSPKKMVRLPLYCCRELFLPRMLCRFPFVVWFPQMTRQTATTNTSCQVGPISSVYFRRSLCHHVAPWQPLGIAIPRLEPTARGHGSTKAPLNDCYSPVSPVAGA